MLKLPQIEIGIWDVIQISYPFQDNICIFYLPAVLHCLFQQPLKLKSHQLLLQRTKQLLDQPDCSLT